jgi:hypothetical protein
LVGPVSFVGPGALGRRNSVLQAIGRDTPGGGAA